MEWFIYGHNAQSVSVEKGTGAPPLPALAQVRCVRVWMASAKRHKLKLSQQLKAAHHIIVSSGETVGAFNTGFVTVNLHRATSAKERDTARTSVHRSA